MRLVLAVLSFIATLVYADTAMAKELSKESQTPAVTIEETIDAAKKMIKKCSLGTMVRQMQQKYDSDDNGPVIGCRKYERQDVLDMSKSVSKSRPKLANKVKDMTAQWLTVMDAIGNSTFADENSKFETLANRLSLE